MAHDHVVYDADPHFEIDPDTRALTYTSPEKLTIMHNDHNSEIVTFDMPRWIDGHDMLLCNKIQVHFVNIDGNKSSNRVSGMYTVVDAQTKSGDPDDNTIVFSWPISRSATSLVGTLHFAIRFACMEGSRLTYAWNTSVYTGIHISSSLDNTETIGEEYLDTVHEWYYDLVSAGIMGVNSIADAAEDAIARIAANGGVIVSNIEPTSPTVVLWVKPDDNDQYILRIRDKTTGVFKVLPSIKGDKGDPGSISNIAHEAGTSKELAMSQYGATEMIDAVDEKINAVEEKYRKKYREFVYSAKATESEEDTKFEFKYVSNTPGLDGGDAYFVTGVKSSSNQTIIIPSTHNGKKVIGIGAGFAVPEHCTRIILPSTIQYFTAASNYSGELSGAGAFHGPDLHPDTPYQFSTIIDLSLTERRIEVDTFLEFDGYWGLVGGVVNPTTDHILAVASTRSLGTKIRVPAAFYDYYVSAWSAIPVEFEAVEDGAFFVDEYQAGAKLPSIFWVDERNAVY